MFNRRKIKITYPNEELMQKYDSKLIYKMFNYIANEDDLIEVFNDCIALPNNPNIYELEDLMEDEMKLGCINEFDTDIDNQIDFQMKKFSIKNKKDLRMNGISFIKVDDHNYIKYEGIVG